MKSVLIREMNRSELPQVLDLYQQPDMDNGLAIDLNSAEAMLTSLERYPFYRYYVAIDGDTNADQPATEVLGVFGLLIMDNLGHSGTPSGIVEGVCVDPAHQDQGIGRKMMQAAMDICRENGCYKIALSSNLKRTLAHDFYRSLGFDQHGISFHIRLN